MRKYHKDGTVPVLSKNTIFVFGSNLSGRHGAGSAREALLSYGAKYGNGIGVSGNSYAIPTKDRNIDSMLICDIIPYIDAFVNYSIESYNVEFFVTRIGCGLAGFKDKDMAPLFKNCGANCSFAEGWQRWLV